MTKSHPKSVLWIFSIFNEVKNDYFWRNVAFLREQRQTFVVVDGGSTDGTLGKLSELAIPHQSLHQSTRGARFNLGLLHPHLGKIVFIHPRTLIPRDAVEALKEISPAYPWGAFTHCFDDSHFLLAFTSWWSNHVRGDIKGIYYLDHILWVEREFMDLVGGFPTDDIFEDTILCQKLLKRSRPTRLHPIAVTSAIRFKKNGILKQSLLNQAMKLRFLFGSATSDINKSYEAGIELNGKTSS